MKREVALFLCVGLIVFMGAGVNASPVGDLVESFWNVITGNVIEEGDVPADDGIVDDDVITVIDPDTGTSDPEIIIDPDTGETIITPIGGTGTLMPGIPVCGNEKVETGEECDDGNKIETDLCANSCKLTICGDGDVQNPNSDNQKEECDDGNVKNGDGCSSVCAWEEKVTRVVNIKTNSTAVIFTIENPVGDCYFEFPFKGLNLFSIKKGSGSQSYVSAGKFIDKKSYSFRVICNVKFSKGKRIYSEEINSSKLYFTWGKILTNATSNKTTPANSTKKLPPTNLTNNTNPGNDTPQDSPTGDDLIPSSSKNEPWRCTEEDLSISWENVKTFLGNRVIAKINGGSDCADRIFEYSVFDEDFVFDDPLADYVQIILDGEGYTEISFKSTEEEHGKEFTFWERGKIEAYVILKEKDGEITPIRSDILHISYD